MNKTFKTVWNRVRRAYVAVNETVSSTAQSAGPTLRNGGVSVSQSGSLRRTALALAVGSALALSIGSAHADVTFPGGCASVGGTMKDGVCYVGDGTQTSTVIEAVNDNWTNTGKLTISGGSGQSDYGIDSFASNGGSGRIVNNEGAKTTITGGTERYSYGINNLATDTGSTGIIENFGSMSITSGSFINSSGIGSIASNGGIGQIINRKSGELTIAGVSGYAISTIGTGIGSSGTIENWGTMDITGGSDYGATGILDVASDGGTGQITNQEGAILTISNGSDSSADGIAYFATGSGSTGILENSGTITLTINSEADSNSISYFAHDGGTAKFINNSGAILMIAGNPKSYNAIINDFAYGAGSTGIIENSGSITINGGSAQKANGINFFSVDGGSGKIVNNNGGKLAINGGTGERAYGIENFANFDSIGTIENSGTITITGGYSSGILFFVSEGGTGSIINNKGAELTISGGSAASGIANVFSGSGATGTIENSGTFKITGVDSVGIEDVVSDGGTGKIINNKGAEFSITGDSSSGISSFVSGIGSLGTIENHGKLTVSGGSSSLTYGIRNLVSDGIAKILNRAGAELSITGGSSTNAAGILNFASGRDSTGTIENYGILTITGYTSSGVSNLASSRGTGQLINFAGAELTINGESGAYGIATLGASGSTGSIENSGTLNLDKWAIGSFGDGNASVTNKSSGTVNAEVEAIFEDGGTTTTRTQKDITVVTSAVASNVKTDAYGTTTVTEEGWVLKDDWANHSVWEDGGQLTITDIADGTYDAQTIKENFEEQFGTGTTITFTGEGGKSEGESSITADAFTMTVVNSLISEGKAFDGSVIVSETLDALNSNFTLGRYGTLNKNFGFQGLTNVTRVTIRDGYSLVLAGDAVASASAFDLTDGTPVSVSDGRLVLGLNVAPYSDYRGIVDTVTLDTNSGQAVLEAAAGEFTAGKVNAVQNGLVSVAQNATLTISDLDTDATSSVDVEESGSLHLTGAAVIAGSVANSGSIDAADTLTVSGNWTGAGTIANNKSITASNWTVSNTINNSKDNSVVTLSSGTNSLGIVVGGKLVANADFSADTLRNVKSLSVSSSVDGQIEALAADTITNAGVLEVKSLTKAEGVDYTQTAGSISVTDNWFANSTLKFNGGTLSRSSLGSNTVTVSGADLDLESITSETDFTLNSGTVTADQITLTENGKFTVSGGTLETNYDSIFTKSVSEAVGLNVIGLDSTKPETVETVLTDLFSRYVAGDVAQSIVQNATFDSGKLVINVDHLSTTERDDLAKAFNKIFADTAIEFKGDVSGQSEESQLTVAKVNELQKNVADLASVIYVDRKLQGENKNVSIGGASGIGQSVGFAGIENAASVAVEGGRKLVLIGGNAADYAVTSNSTITTVSDGSTLELGSLGSDTANKGTMGTVVLSSNSDEAQLKAVTGQFTIAKVDASKNGLVSVAQNATLSITDLDTDATSSVNVDESGSLNLTGAAVIAGAVANAGSIDAADTLTVSGNWTGTGTIANNKSISASNWSVANTINNETDSTVVTFASGTNAVGTIVGGKIEAKADFTADALSNVKSLDVASSVEGQINALAADTITNAGVLDVKNLAKTKGVDYTQTAGSITVTDNWFADSTLKLNGGTLVRDSLGSNDVTVAGASVDVDTLTSDTNFTLNSGSVSADSIDLSQKDRFTVAGGTLETNYESIFTESTAEEVGLNVIGLDAQAPESVKNILTEFFTRYVAGDVAESIAQNAVFEGGKLIVKVDHLTTTQRDDLTEAFNKIFADAAIEFQGDISGTTEDSKLTVAKVNQLQANVAELASVIYVDRNLQGENTDVSVGGTSGIAQSVGFAGIENAKSVTVEGGKKLVLIGGDTADYAMTADSTTTTVRAGSTLELGSLGSETANKGTMGAVTLSSASGQAQLKAVTGEFAIAKVDAKQNGLVTVAQNAVLSIADLDADSTSGLDIAHAGSLKLTGEASVAGSVKNEGTISADETLAAAGSWTGSGTIANAKEISASDWSVANTINNATDDSVVTFASGTNTVGAVVGGKVAANADFSATSLKGVKSLSVSEAVDARIDSLAADAIVNAGSLAVSTLAKAENVVYTQTAGSIEVTDNWFANSTVNLNGGTLVRDSLGANTATVAGADVDLGSITSDTDFTLTSGSVSADTINLTEEGKFSVSGGELSTGYSNIFTESIAEAVGLNVIGLESGQPEAVKNVLTEFFTRYIAGDVAESIAQNASFEGGKLVINVDHLSTTERDDLTAAFNKIFADTTVEFKGDISGVSEDSRLTVAKVNDLQKNVADLASVIYVDRKLQGDNAAVSVGGASGIGQSVGFAGIENTSSITVEGGRKLVLIGSSASDYAMTDAGATTSIRAGSALELGSLGLEKANTGTMGNVAMAGGDMSRANFTVVNGTYSMGALTGSRGNVRVDQGAAFTAASLELADSEITNAGTLTVTGDVSLDSTNLTNEERMTVSGSLKLSGVLTNTAGAFLETNEMSVTGQLSNFGEIEASDTSTVYGTLENQSVIRLYDTQIGDRGALHNTATLTQTGTTTVNGLLSNLASGNAEMDTVILDGENAVLENTGMLIINHLIVRNSASASNGAQSSGIAFFAPRAGGTSIVGTLDVESDENYSNSGNLYVGQSTIQGNLINAEGGLAQFGVNQYFADGKGLSVTAEGSVDNDGSLILSGALSNAGKISGTGTVAFAAADGATNVFENTGSIEASSVSASGTGADRRITINNSGTISADELSIAYADYTQTAGSASFDKGGFENSNVNLEGGSMALEALGSGNAYTVGGSAAGTSSNLNVGTITSDSTLTIAEGGRVHVDTIDLTGSKTAHLLGGTLATTLDQIFADVDTHAHDIDAENPGDIVDPGVDVVVGVGDVIDSVAAGIEFGWGTVAFDDAMYSASVAGDVLTKLDAIDDNDPSWGALEVAFNGEASETFDVDTANRVKATDAEGGSTYAVFIGETLHNTTEANPGYTALYVGSAEDAAAAGVTDVNILDNSIGFKQVVNVAGGMTVADGRHFVLVGENQSTAGDFELIDGNLSIVRNGMVTLGSYAAQEATKGALRDVALSEGTLRVRHGSFSAQNVTSAGTVYIGGDGAEHGGAVLPEDTTSSFAVESFTAQSGSELINWGTFAVGDLKTDGEDAGTLTNYGLIDVTTAEVDMAVTNLKTAEFDALTLTGGSFVNGAQDAEDKAAATVTAATLALNAGSVFTNYGTTSADNGSIGGEFVNEAGASVTWDALSVADAGKLDNRGTAAAGSITQTGGSIVNSGEFTLNSDAASSIAGSLNNTGSFTVEEGCALTIAENGSIVNSGSGTFNVAADISISGGTLTQDSTGAMTLGNVSIADGKLVVTSGKSVSGSGELSVNKTPGEAAVENDGSVEFGSINAAQGSITGTGTLVAESTLTVGENGSVDQTNVDAGSLTNSGNITADNLTIAGSGDNSGQMSLSESLNGNLTNSGQLTIEGGENFTLAGGTVINNGNVLARENVTIDGGHFVQSSSMGAWFNDLTIKSGDVTVEAGKAIHGFVGDTLTVDMGSAQDVAVVNDGSINYGSISVNQGKITGSGTFGTAGSQITVGESGSIEQGTVIGSSLANAGTITVDTINVSRGSNSGNLTAEDAVFTSAFDNRAEGEMNLNGSLEGSVNNEGTLTLGDGFEFASGTIENTGTLTGTGSITIAGGTIHQASDTEAVFGNVAINGGALNVEAGKSASGDALTVAMGSAEDVASVNNGTLDFESIGVDQGKITGSGTLGGETSSITVGVNGSVEQGSIIGSQINNEGLISGNVTAAAGSNTGTITAGDFTVGKGGQFVNAGTITTSGAADVANVDNRKDMTFGNGAAFSGGNVNTGTITVNGGKLTVATGDNATSGTGSLTVNAGLDVGADGKLTIEGPDASASITGGATVSGTFATSGNTSIDRITSESTGHIVAEGGKLHLGDLTDAEGMTFTQKTDTDLSLGKGWFENSTINIEGGKFDASIIKDDEGNSSGMLGHNTVNISGKNPTPIINSGDPSEEKIHYKDNLTVVTVETVTSDTTINIGSGGVLDVDNISLTPENDQASITLDGGVLETSLDQIFDYVATEAIKIENDETVFLPTEVLTATAVGEVKDEIASGLELGSGTIAFNDDYYSASAVISTALQLQNGFGEAASNVTTVFLGDMSGELTVDTVHDLEKEGLEDVLAGVILATETLQNTTAAEGAANTGLVIGGAAGESENQINVSIGFKDVAKADSVRIEGGKTFVLVGGERPADFDWTTGYGDGNKLLTDASDGGSVSVNNGRFELGTNGSANATVGWVNSTDISENGSMHVENGEFADWWIANEGKLTIASNGTLHTISITGSGSTVNDGTLTVGTDANEGALEVGTGGFVNNGTLDATHVADTVVAGDLFNEGRAEYDDMTITAGGSSVNEGYERGDILTVESGASHSNTGVSIWNGMTIADGASGSNGKPLADDAPKGHEEGFASDALLQVGTDAADETFDISGSFDNHGVLDADAMETTLVAGDLFNEGQAVYNDMTVVNGGSSVNEGYEKGDILTVEGGASHSNTGVSIWNGMTIADGASGSNGKPLADDAPKGHEEGFVSDSAVQIGSAETGGVFEIGGSFDNHGILDASEVETTEVAGDLFNEGRAEYDDMNVTGGGSSINAGFERGDILTVSDGSTHENTGVSIWNNIKITEGSSGSNGTTLAEDAPKGHEEGFATDSIVQVGTDAADEVFEIAGSYDNHGRLDAAAIETTDVAGDLYNEGQATYDDMDIADGGSSVNEGYERGDILTVSDGGTHTNTGVSIWNNIQISEGGSGSNGNPLAPDAPKGHEEGFDTDSFVTVGTDNPDEEFRIDGSFENHGGLDATETETTTVTGDLFNDGQARYDDMTITAGGSSDNDGYERGDILTVEDGGTHDNSGISIWNNIQITEGGSGENSGDLTLGDKDSDEDGSFEIGGDFTNTEDGTLDATDVPETIVGGDLTNDGNANYDDMHVDGGNSENNGREEGDILTVDNGGTHTNTGESIWNNITVGDGGKHTNKGTESADEIVIDGGIYEVADGTTVGDNVTINSGDLVIGNKLELSPDNEAEFIMKKPNPINGHVWVIGNGHLGVGDGSDTFGGEMGAAGLPEAPARVTVTAPVTIGEGSLAVGQGTYTDPDNKLQLGNGDLYFAEDSYTLISAGAVNEETAAFTGTVDGAKVTVEEGATLVLGNINNTGKYLITSGFDTTGNSEEGTWLGGWLDEDNLFALPQDGSGLGWDLKLDFSADEIWVIADLDDVTTVYPDISIPDITNDDMDQNKPEDKGDEFIQDTLRDEDLSVEEKTKIINSVAEIGFAGGAHSTAFDDMGAATDAIENRVSFGGSHFDGSGTLIRDVHGASVWVDVLGGTRKTKNLEASGRMEGGSDVDSYGFVFGTDYVTASQSAVFGAAFSYSKGDVESSGDWLKTMSNTESYGLHLYGAWTPNERFNVVGTLAYQWSTADISQTIGAAGFGSASADIDTQFVSAGVRGEYRWQVKDGLAVIPHAGLRALYGMTDGYDTKVDGQKAFGNDADNTLTFQMPIGVALRADYLTASGWNWRGTGDISVIPQFGDTDQDVTVYNSRNVDDVITGEFTGNFVTRAKLGFEATKGMTTFGLDYGFATGDSIESHQINAKIRFVF